MANVEKLVSSLETDTKGVKESIEWWQKRLAVHRRLDGKFESDYVEDNQKEHVILDAFEKHLAGLNKTVGALSSTVVNLKKLHINLAARILALEKRCKKVAKVVVTEGGGV